MSFVFFVVFSLIEILAMLWVCCSLFRFKVNQYIVKFMIVEIFIISGNYLIRQEAAYTDLAPLFSLIMLILFLRIFLEEVSLLWAAVIGVLGYIISTIIQGLVVLVIFNTTTISTISELQDSHLYSYIVQFAFAIITIIPAQYLYKKGIGFTFNLDRFKLVGENIIILSILFIIVCLVGVLFFTGDLLLIMIVLILPLLYLVYYTVRKQREASNNTSLME